MDSRARLAAVATKEAREILRDPITLGVAIVLPLLMMVLFTYAITLDVRDIGLAILDEDRSAESREYVAAFRRSGYFQLAATARDVGEVGRLLDGGAARVALVILPASRGPSSRGGGPSYYVLRDEIELANVIQMDAMARSRAEQSLVALKTTLGIDLASAIALADRLVHTPVQCLGSLFRECPAFVGERANCFS